MQTNQTKTIGSSKMSQQSIIEQLRSQIHETFIGKDEVIDLTLTCLVAQGHLLIEDVPGVGKTSLGSVLARSLEASFQRIQFTSDLLPSDILGVPIFNQQTKAFEFHPGPIFSHFVLADEINRTTPKTQSALLEAMQEYQVTIDRKSYPLQKPFMVIATQNPIEQFGTYPLPESQLDRFLFKISMGYPTKNEELGIMLHPSDAKSHFDIDTPVCSVSDVLRIQQEAQSIKVDQSLQNYLVELVHKTRITNDLRLGVSPRGSIALYRASQAYALVQGRSYVIPDDIKKLAVHTLSHRIILNENRVAKTSDHELNNQRKEIIQEIVESHPVPIS